MTLVGSLYTKAGPDWRTLVQVVNLEMIPGSRSEGVGKWDKEGRKGNRVLSLLWAIEYWSSEGPLRYHKRPATKLFHSGLGKVGYLSTNSIPYWSRNFTGSDKSQHFWSAEQDALVLEEALGQRNRQFHRLGWAAVQVDSNFPPEL